MIWAALLSVAALIALGPANVLAQDVIKFGV